MFGRGRLIGALVLGAKRSGEPYAPDESDAIRQLTDGIGAALDILSTNGAGVRNELLAAIHALPDAIVERLRSAREEI